jgi:hypothetical protein
MAFNLVVKTSPSLDAYLVCHVAMFFSVACVLMRVALGRSQTGARGCSVCVRILLVEGSLEGDACKDTKDVNYAFISIVEPPRAV